METLHDVAASVAPSTTRRWFDLEEQVGGQIHDVQSWAIGPS